MNMNSRKQDARSQVKVEGSGFNNPQGGEHEFSDQRIYNDYVDTVVCGPLTTREIRALIWAGERFPSRTLDTEMSLAALESLPRAPDALGGVGRRYAQGRMEGLLAVSARVGDVDWLGGYSEAVAMVEDAAWH